MIEGSELPVGRSVGDNEGLTLTLGRSEGAALGDTLTEGTSVGLDEGTTLTLGVLLGANDGATLTLGLSLGAALGLGLLLGAELGKRVNGVLGGPGFGPSTQKNACVIAPQPPRFTSTLLTSKTFRVTFWNEFGPRFIAGKVDTIPPLVVTSTKVLSSEIPNKPIWKNSSMALLKVKEMTPPPSLESH